MTNNTMKVLIVDDIPETREMLQKLLTFEKDIEVIGIAATGREALDFTNQFKPDIVLMDINMPDMDGITATEEIKKIHSGVGVIIMSVQSESDYLRRAMMAGARDFVSKPISSEILYATILRVYDLLAEERHRTSSHNFSVREEKKAVSGHIITVYSPQGGAGVTTVATNLAIALLHQNSRVVLIDGNLQWGNVDVFLNLSSNYNIRDLADSITDLDQQLIESVIVSHESGLRVLLAPHNIQEAEQIASSALALIIQQIAPYYEYVVVDLPKHLDETTLGIMDYAERIILVSTPTLPAIKSTRNMLNLFLALNYPTEKVMFVMNRVRSDGQGRASIPLEAIENNLKRLIDARIPLDETSFLFAVNHGVSVIATDPQKSPATDLIRLANQVRQSLKGEEEPTPDISKLPARRSKIWAGFKN